MTRASTLLTAALAALSFATAEAQIGIGIQGGFINSNATYEDLADGGDGELDTESITAWTVGIPVEISIGKVFAIQPEINLLRRGYDFGDTPFEETTNREFTVVSIPVLGKLGYVGDAFTAAATFGPAFQYVASGKQDLVDVSVGGVGVREDVDIDFDEPRYEDFNRTAVYGILGAQVGLPIGFGKFVVDGRYRFQLNDEEGRDDVEVRGRGFSATAGLIFTLGNY